MPTALVENLSDLLSKTLTSIVAKPMGELDYGELGHFFVGQYGLAFGLLDLLGSDQVAKMVDGVAATATYFSMFLMVLVFIKKGVGCYVLWSDGDPDVGPSQLVIRFVMAMGAAVSAGLVYDLVLEIAGGVAGAIGAQALPTPIDMVASAIRRLIGVNLLYSVVALIAVCMMIGAGVRIAGQGIMLIALKLMLPLSCIGLLDNDKGLFAETWKALVRTVATVILQYLCLNIGIYIIINTQAGAGGFGSGGLFSYMVALTVIGSSGKVAALLTGIFAPVQQQGGALQKASSAMHMTSMTRNFVKSLGKA